MKISIIIIFIIFSVLANSQSTFEYLISRPENEISRSIIEDQEGNIYFSVEQFQHGLIIKLNDQGQFVDSIHIDNPEGTCNIGELISLDSNFFIALGSWTVDSISQLWYIKFDYNLQIIDEKKLNSEGWRIYDFKHIINHGNNVVFVALYDEPGSYFEICIYEITKDGQILRNEFFPPLFTNNQAYTLLENSLDFTYKIFTRYGISGRPANSFSILDSNFNIIMNHGTFHDSIYSHNTAKWINDSTYLLTGKNIFNGSDDWNLGILKVTSDDHVLSTTYIGVQDTVEWPGIYKNLDFISLTNIFYIGTSNSFWYPFQMEPSWIMINRLDSDLNLKSQQYYGGDAFYLVNTVLATKDSGCVMACSRYDYLTQNNEFDVYILKVNKDGLLVSVPDNATINQSVCELYPNPGIDKLYIEAKMDELHIELFDITGKIMTTFQLVSGGNILEISEVPAGIYLYRIFDKRKRLLQTGKWLKF